MGWSAENLPWRERARERWSPRENQPLTIRAWLASAVAWDGYDPITIEGPLQAIVCQMATGRAPDDVFADCPISAQLKETDITIPIADAHWGGTPIAMASCGWFAPGATVDRVWWRKRTDSEYLAHPKVNIAMGDTKTSQSPQPTIVAPYVDFFVHGDAAKLRSLLREISHLGAKRSGGLGVVEGWELLPGTDGSWRQVGPKRCLMRALPLGMAEAAESTRYTVREATTRAPYWHQRTLTECAVPIQVIGDYV